MTRLKVSKRKVSASRGSRIARVQVYDFDGVHQVDVKRGGRERRYHAGDDSLTRLAMAVYKLELEKRAFVRPWLGGWAGWSADIRRPAKEV